MTPPRPNEGIDIEKLSIEISELYGQTPLEVNQLSMDVFKLCTRIQAETEAIVTKRERDTLWRRIHSECPIKFPMECSDQFGYHAAADIVRDLVQALELAVENCPHSMGYPCGYCSGMKKALAAYATPQNDGQRDSGEK